ncbi:MAG TPA: hypothetical protein PLA50_10400, partial [Bacteroidia bacterium]|nr:hypothetical protein [Bacteroidia bacterium]
MTESRAEGRKSSLRFEKQSAGKFRSGLFESDQGSTGGPAFTMDEAVDESRLGRGEVWKIENLPGRRADKDRLGPGKKTEGRQGIGLAESVVVLKGEIAFRKDDVSDVQGNADGALRVEEGGDALELGERLADDQPQHA